MNVVFVASRPDRSKAGQARALRIEYTVGGIRYAKENSLAFRVTGACD